MKRLSACAHEDRLAFDPDLLERLEAVGNEARTDNVDARQALPSELAEDCGGVGRQPGRAPEPRLKRDLPRAVGQLQIFRQQARGLLTLAMVRIPALEGVARQPMEAQHEPVRAAVDAPVVAD